MANFQFVRHARAFAVGIAFLLAGCATQAQQQATAIVQNTQSAMLAMRSCLMSVFSNAEYAPVVQHGSFDIREATLQQLTDETFATRDEIRLIYKMHPQAQACRTTTLTQLSETTPTIVPILTDAMIAAENALIDVVRKKITWGAYVRTLRGEYQIEMPRVTAELQRISSGLEQENQAELAQRQAALDSVARFYQTEQIINAMNRPVVTNCNTFGNTTNCITH